MNEISQLNFEEIRILGALIEKSKTTPDYYPMTLNGLVTACNQKSSRNPVESKLQTHFTITMKCVLFQLNLKYPNTLSQ